MSTAITTFWIRHEVRCRTYEDYFDTYDLRTTKLTPWDHGLYAREVVEFWQ